MNNLVYFRGNSGRVCDCDSFLGYWGNNLVYFGGILVGPIIVIVSWATGEYLFFLFIFEVYSGL